jgi:hypothetical protein
MFLGFVAHNRETWGGKVRTSCPVGSQLPYGAARLYYVSRYVDAYENHSRANWNG